MDQANENVHHNVIKKQTQSNDQSFRLITPHLAAKSSNIHQIAANSISIDDQSLPRSNISRPFPLKQVNPNNHENLPPSREELDRTPLVLQHNNSGKILNTIDTANAHPLPSKNTRLDGFNNKRLIMNFPMDSDIEAAKSELKFLQKQSIQSLARSDTEYVNDEGGDEIEENNEEGDDDDEVFYETSPDILSVRPTAIVDDIEHSHYQKTQQGSELPKELTYNAYDHGLEYANVDEVLDADSSFSSNYYPTLLTESLRPLVNHTVTPHMLCPLPDDSIPFQIVTFETAAENQNLLPFAPFGTLISDFECYENNYEQKLLNVLNLDIEALDENEVPGPISSNFGDTQDFLWNKIYHVLRQVWVFVISLIKESSDEEYLTKYPWARYVHSNEDEDSEDEKQVDFDVNSFHSGEG